MMPYKDKSIILFDGVCNLCNSSIQFIIKRDKNNHFYFASLQSDAGQQILLQNNLENLDFNTIILFDKGKIHDKSTAVLKISKHLSNLYPLLYGFIIIPKFIRDGVYNFISKNRYKWFGKQESCMIPTPELKSKFLT